MTLVSMPSSSAVCVCVKRRAPTSAAIAPANSAFTGASSGSATSKSANTFPLLSGTLLSSARFISAFPSAGCPGKPQGKEFRLRVRTEESERELLLQVGDAVTLTDWDGGAADGELRIPAEAFVRLNYGRLDPDHTVLTGPVSLSDRRRVFPGV